MSVEETEEDAEVGVGDEEDEEDHAQTQRNGPGRRGPEVQAVEHLDSENHEDGDVW